MSVYRMGLVWQFSRASGSLLLLLLAIADYADDEGVAFPALETLARKVRKGERQTRTLIREAEAIGELEVYQQAMPLRTGGGLQRTNVYVLTGEGGRRASSPFEKGGQSSVEGGAGATAPEPLEEPLAPRELGL